MSAVAPINLTTEQFVTSAKEKTGAETKINNIFALSKLDKISINVGVGKLDPKQKQDVANYLETLTGQKAKQVKTRKSIASFKLRAGDVVGLVVTLRSKKMYDFLLHLIYIALPRSRDFKGIKSQSFDKNYNCYSLGIESASIFPPIGFDTTVNFGMQINICFKQGKEENKILLNNFNFPFKK